MTIINNRIEYKTVRYCSREIGQNKVYRYGIDRRKLIKLFGYVRWGRWKPIVCYSLFDSLQDSIILKFNTKHEAEREIERIKED